MNHFCRQASRLASDAMERNLTWGESVRLNMHLAMCGACRNHARDVHVIRSTLQAMRNSTESNTAITLPEQDRRRILLALQQIAEK